MNAAWINFPRQELCPIIVTPSTTTEDFLSAATIFKDQAERGVDRLKATTSYDMEMYHPIFTLLNDQQHERTEMISKQIESRIKGFQAHYPNQINTMLSRFYRATADIEFQKLSAVMEYPRSHHSRILQYYNHLRKLLLQTTEKSLNILINHQKAIHLQNKTNYRELHDCFYKNPHPTTQTGELSRAEKQGVQMWFQGRGGTQMNTTKRFSPY